MDSDARRRMTTAQGSSPKFSVYRNPALAAASTANSLRPSKSVLLFIFLLSTAFALISFMAGEKILTNALTSGNISQEAAYVTVKAWQGVVTLFCIGAMMALSKGIYLHREKFAAPEETKSSSKKTKDQFSLSNRQLELLRIKKKSDHGVSQGPKSRPAWKSSQSLEPLVPIHQTLTGSAHKSSSGGDKMSSRNGSQISPFSTPSKQMDSPSLYLVPCNSPASSNRASSGQDKAVSRSAKDIGTEEQLEQLLADIDEKITESAGKILTPPPTVASFPMASPSQSTINHSVQNLVWKPKSYGTVSGSSSATTPQKVGLNQSKLFGADFLESFTVDKSTYCNAQIRATFYPKFENEKTDQEIRTRMIEMVSKGLATVEVSLKHSGSLFMYAGNTGGAYAKNSFGNIYTAVGVFVLSRVFREAWPTKALEKQAEFNDFLEKSRMCISMELVTAVLGDHDQRPLDDYVVVTAVTELGNGKPKFYSTSEIIAFCRKWRLPNNHVWLFSTRKSVTSFFAAFDALCEEGIATSVCRALDEVADISVPASKDHVEVQGEILEGLVARIVSSGSTRNMENVLRDHPPPPHDGANLDLGLSLREICAAHRSNEKQQMKAILRSVGSSFCPSDLDWFGDESVDSHSKNADKSVVTKFLQSQPVDYSTSKLQEMARLMKEKRLPAAFKCYHNFHRANDVSPDNLFYKLVVHVRSDSGFRRYQKEMRQMPSLWPLYRGFFVDINLFKSNKGKDPMAMNSIDDAIKDASENVGQHGKDGLADDDANLMIKMKFLPYKLRTFLIRNGLSVLFKEGPASYKAYYLR